MNDDKIEDEDVLLPGFQDDTGLKSSCSLVPINPFTPALEFRGDNYVCTALYIGLYMILTVARICVSSVACNGTVATSDDRIGKLHKFTDTASCLARCTLCNSSRAVSHVHTMLASRFFRSGSNDALANSNDPGPSGRGAPPLER